MQTCVTMKTQKKVAFFRTEHVRRSEVHYDDILSTKNGNMTTNLKSNFGHFYNSLLMGLCCRLHIFTIIFGTRSLEQSSVVHLRSC